MVIQTRTAISKGLKHPSEELMPSHPQVDAWVHDAEEIEQEDDYRSDAPRPKTRQARPRGKNQSKRKGFSVLRYRVQEFKQKSHLSPAHEFDSSLRTLRFDPASLCISELTDPQVKAVVHRSEQRTAAPVPLNALADVSSLQATTFFWPAFRIYADTNIIDPWLEQMYRFTVLYHSVLAGHGSMMKAYNANCTTPRADAFIQRNAAAAMREMRRLAEMHQQATDEMLIAASYLALTPRPRSERHGRVGGLGFGLFTPPLQKLQAMDCHGKIYFADPHRSAAMLMVKQRGGIKDVRATGIAEALQCFDLHSSAQGLEPPTLELARSAEHFIRTILEPERKKWREVAASCLQTTIPSADDSPATTGTDAFSFGFDALDLPTNMTSLLVDMRVYSGHVHSFVSGEPSLRASDLAMFRNVIQYRLLQTLPLVTDDDDVAAASLSSSHTRLVRELTLLGAALFAYGALYPSPPWDAKRKLLEMLRARLRAVVVGGLDRWKTRDELGLLLWVALLGCMMGVGPDVVDGDGVAFDGGKGGTLDEFQIGAGGGDVFFTLLVWCRTRLCVSEYTEAREVMQRWLWLEEACDEGARRVWSAAAPA